MSKVEERKEKFKNWFKESHNLIFLGILAAAIIIRIIFFLKTMNQPVWWDEGEYLAMAKSFAHNIPFNFNAQRGPLFSLVVASLFIIDASEPVVRFIAVVIPSLLVVVASYFLGSALYSKKTGLIFAFLNAVFWVSLFNTTRIHTDMLALLFAILSLYIFWRYYVVEKNIKYLWLLGLFTALGFATRSQNALIPAGMVVYLLLTENYKFLLKKELWITFLVFLIAVSPLIIWNTYQFDKPLAQVWGYASTQSLEEKSHYPIAWNVWEIFPIYLLPNNSFLGIIFLILFLIGLVTFSNVVLGFDIVMKNQDKKLNADAFVLILFFTSIIYFMFIERPSVYGYDPKWLIFSGLAMFLIISKGSLQLDEWLSRHLKIFSLIIIAILLILAAIPQISNTNTLVEQKKDSYLQVKEAGLWLKEHTSPGEVIYSHSSTQTTYYSDRHTKGIPPTYEDFVKDQREDNARFFTVSVFEKHPEWAYNYPQQHPDEFIPVQAYTLNNQPALVIYQYNPKSSPERFNQTN
ncbi:MAG TPA: glycosyltransferase family 39 protein [Candidatus Nanoarchaeia archaeon]|nr:glycosyltransferase family 39 protein [Candidatus Nanoarchaeia archaeon]